MKLTKTQKYLVIGGSITVVGTLGVIYGKRIFDYIKKRNFSKAINDLKHESISKGVLIDTSRTDEELIKKLKEDKNNPSLLVVDNPGSLVESVTFTNKEKQKGVLINKSSNADLLNKRANLLNKTRPVTDIEKGGFLLL